MSDNAQERKELAEAARVLLDDKALQAAILALRKQWYAELMASTSEYDDRALKAQLRALEALPLQLTSFVNDQLMFKRKSG